MIESSNRRRGRPQVYADTRLVFSGIALHPRQNGRLRSYAERRGTTMAAVLRQIVSAWEQEQGWEEPTEGQGALPL